MERLTREDAQKVAVASQYLTQTTHPRPLEDVIRRLLAIQIDSINIAGYAHYHVLRARGVPHQHISQIHQSESRLCELWVHAHSLIHTQDWCLFEWSRQLFTDKARTKQIDPTLTHAAQTLAAEGSPFIDTDITPRNGTGWNSWTPARQACHYLLNQGQLVVTSRDNRLRKQFTGAQHHTFTHHKPITAQNALELCVTRVLQALGLATVADIADYLRYPKKKDIEEILRRLPDVTAVHCEGSDHTYFLAPRALDLMAQSTFRDDYIPLSPFDNLVWYRPRAEELFGYQGKLEAYKKAADREFGYYGMPILHQWRIVGRVAPRIDKGHLTIENFELYEDLNEAKVIEDLTAYFALGMQA